MAVKVYRYGCKIPNDEVVNAIRDQLLIAHNYRCALWNLSVASRRQYRERRRQFFPELAAKEDSTVALKECILQLYKESAHKTDEGKAQIKAYQKEIKELQASSKELREKAKEDERFNIAVKADKAREAVLRRACRKVFSRYYGLYSGTYLHVEDADRRSRSGLRDPVRPRWSGTGALAIQLQGGRSVAQLTSGNDPSIWIKLPNREGKSKKIGSRTPVKYRIRSDDKGRPICVVMPTMYSRDLPEDAVVKWAKLVVSLVGDAIQGRHIYSIQFTLESEMNKRREFGSGRVAVCFCDDTVTYADESGVENEFKTSANFDFVRHLQSVRDKNRHTLINEVRGWAGYVESPPWFVDHFEKQHRDKKGCRQMVRFASRRGVQVLLPKDICSRVKAWIEQENHLYKWQSDARRKMLNRRTYEFYCFSKKLRNTYHTLIMDNRKLDSPERKSYDNNTKALCELRNILEHRFGEEVIHALGKSCAELFDAGARAEKKQYREKAIA